MESVIKLKLKLSEEDQRILESQSRICNWLYNRLLEQANELKKQYLATNDPELAKTLYTKRGLRNLIPSMKSEHPFLKSVHSSPLKNVGLRLSESIQAYQKSRKGTRKGKATGWPRFRANKVKAFSLLYDEPKKGFELSGKLLRLSLGVNEDGKRHHINVELEKSIGDFADAEIRQLRIKQDLGQFYAIFTIKREAPPQKNSQDKRVIALDPNHKNLSWGVDNEGRSIEIKNPWFMKELQRRINKLKSKRDRCKKKSQVLISEHGREYTLASRRWRYLNKILERLYQKRREQTKCYLYAVAHHLFKHYDLVSIGNYTPHIDSFGQDLSRNMRREMLNESLIGRFKKTLEWVAQKVGKEFMEWDEYGSTKTCSYCGHSLKQSLSPQIRVWDCPSCQRKLIRDENAACNGLKQTYEYNESLPGSGHLGEISSRCTVKFNGLGFHLMRSGVC